jgi:uncharacterized protein YggE
MNVTIKPPFRAPVVGVGAAALLVGSFMLGTAQSGSASTGSTQAAVTGKITVTGSGTVTGVPNQLILSMGVQVNSSSVSVALSQANVAERHVRSALERSGVAASDIQTAGLSIQPNYHGGSQVPSGYGVSESLTATLTNMHKAGSQIQTAVTAGGNAVTVDGVSLNLSDTGSLLANARAKAVNDAQKKATQFAQALHKSIQGVISISDQSVAVPYPQPYYGLAAGASAQSVPISPGKQQVSVQITVVYAIG